jgi:hypothetical protein
MVEFSTSFLEGQETFLSSRQASLKKVIDLVNTETRGPEPDGLRDLVAAFGLSLWFSGSSHFE